MKVLGIDPGSKSWDFFGLEDDNIIIDISIPSKELIKEPQKAINIIKSLKTIDLIVAPSGFGLPLKEIHELTENDISLILMKFGKDDQNKILGLGQILRLLKTESVKAVIIPGVKHLPTVPEYRKINKIDMGTSDKLCTVVVGIKDQMDHFKSRPEETNFIMVEIGYSFTAILAIENGQIIDGIGGSNIMGFRACGSIDGELACLIKEVKKKHTYKGGLAYIAGDSDLSLEKIVLLAENNEQVKLALNAYISCLEKAIFGISSSFSSKNKILEILLAGRSANLDIIQNRIVRSLKDIAPVRLMTSYSKIAKRAAQGASFIANGILGGIYKPIVDNLRIKEASGSLLDKIFIPFDKNKLFSDLN